MEAGARRPSPERMEAGARRPSPERMEAGARRPSPERMEAGARRPSPEAHWRAAGERRATQEGRESAGEIPTSRGGGLLEEVGRRS
ncbi:hypothetical protein QYE76_007864 [Lolium multiflorum]|uniref:Uncharacterized protein n=1 Tax=Lolium multiflorum TaxID=4521 RepID=A0AAD8VCK8_LOLMU|nr:hypothetical protein QYE76_007864 [Lolium multiflorum]